MRYPKGSKVIRTSTGREILVSASDYGYLSNYTWHIHRSHSGEYARTTIHGRKVRMHRLVMGVTMHPDLEVDHQNWDTLDNRRENLLVCSPAVNLQNRRAPGTAALHWGRRQIGGS